MHELLLERGIVADLGRAGNALNEELADERLTKQRPRNANL
jgi:hypothetical protein